MGVPILGHRDTLNIVKNAIKIKPKPNSTNNPYFYKKNTIFSPKNENNVRPERLSKQDDVKKEENDEKDNAPSNLNEPMRHEESGFIFWNLPSSKNVKNVNQEKEDIISEYGSGKTLLPAAKLSNLQKDKVVPTSQYTNSEPDNKHKEINIDVSEDQIDVQIINDEERTGKNNENKIREKYENNRYEEFEVGMGPVQSSIIGLNYLNKKSINGPSDVINEFDLLTSESTALTNMDTSNTNKESNEEDKDISMKWSGDMEEQAPFNRIYKESVKINGMDIMQEEMNEGYNSKKKKIEKVSVSGKISEEINGISSLASEGMNPITPVPVIEEINVINTILSDEMFDVTVQEQSCITFPAVTEQSNATVTSVAEQNDVTFPSAAKLNNVTFPLVAELNRVTITSVSEQKRVTIPSVSELNSITFPSLAEQNRVTIPSLAEQNRVTNPSLAEQNRVTIPLVAEQSGVTIPSVAMQNSVTIPSLAEQNGVTIPSDPEQKSVFIEYIIEDTADKLPTEKDTTEGIMEDIIEDSQDKVTTENAEMGDIMKESRDIDDNDASFEYNIDVSNVSNTDSSMLITTNEVVDNEDEVLVSMDNNYSKRVVVVEDGFLSCDTGYSTEKERISPEPLMSDLDQDRFVVCSTQARTSSQLDHETEMIEIGTIQSKHFFVENIESKKTVSNRKIQYFIQHF